MDLGGRKEVKEVLALEWRRNKDEMVMIYGILKCPSLQFAQFISCLSNMILSQHNLCASVDSLVIHEMAEGCSMNLDNGYLLGGNYWCRIGSP